MSLTRRAFLGSSLAALVATLQSRHVQAELGRIRRFLFVNAEGGWDPLCTFAPMFGTTGIDMEPQAERWTTRGFSLVDHPARPAFRSFFETWGPRTVLLNGVNTRSVNHETCQAVTLTGGTSPDGTDWATMLATDARVDFLLPHLVLSGPAFAGGQSVLLARAEGQLQAMVDGSIRRAAGLETPAPGGAATRVLDAYLESRAAGFAAGGDARLQRYAEAVRRAHRLVDDRIDFDFRSASEFGARLSAGVRLLEQGTARCVSVGTGFVWDTHENNAEQSPLFDELFTQLGRLLILLTQTTGPDGVPLSDDTVVVVTSEMARTPAYNLSGGRDHWPYTTTMLIGPGLAGGTALGGWNSSFQGVGVLSDGSPNPAQLGISAQQLGATLLWLGGVDSTEWLPGVDPIVGVGA